MRAGWPVAGTACATRSGWRADVLTTRPSRRALLGAAGGLALATACTLVRQREMTTLVAFGDSILDSGRYNAYGVTPGQLLVDNDDRLFPEFRGRDLSSRGPARLEHRARDGPRLATCRPRRRDWRSRGGLWHC